MTGRQGITGASLAPQAAAAGRLHRLHGAERGPADRRAARGELLGRPRHQLLRSGSRGQRLRPRLRRPTDDGDGASAPQDGFARLSAAQLPDRACGAGHRSLDPTRGICRLLGRRLHHPRHRLRRPRVGRRDPALRQQPRPGPARRHRLCLLSRSPGTGGDVWFDEAGRRPVAGNFDFLTVLHETGHALGLKHGHELPLPLPAGLRQARVHGHDLPQLRGRGDRLLPRRALSTSRRPT